MKNGIAAINTAHGGLADACAIIQALRSERVAATGLYVLPDEPLIREEAELICSSYLNQHDLKSR